jgi:uncharacterized protein (TIGR03437 family)
MYMVRTFSVWVVGLNLMCGAAGYAATFGKVVPIGGAGSDLALDEARGYLYIANFTANRVEKMSLATDTIQTSINVPAQPSSLALSPDGRYLVVAHYANFTSPGSPSNGLTVIDLTTNAKQTFVLGNPPLGVAFGSDGRALVATTQEFFLFDPVSGTTQLLDTISGIVAKTLPQPPASFPPNIVAASMAASGDGSTIYGLTDTLMFRYDVNQQQLSVISYVSTPVQGPRVVSVSQDGSYYTSGWALNDRYGDLLAEFPNPTGALNVGSHVIDSKRNLIYAQIPDATAGDNPPPVLQIVDSDNLTVRDRLQLPENLAGKSVLSSDDNTMYSISDSGVMVLPVGNLASQHQLQTSQEDVVFRGDYCNRDVSSQQIMITDPGGGSTSFSVSTDTAGISLSPSSGVTPAIVTVSVDPTAFQNNKGTVAAEINISSSQAVNLPPPVRVLVNMHDPDQRGSFVDVPGTLVDVLADPVRQRFYILRQDKNEVLVFDSTNNTQIATLRTGNVPTQMAITFDQRYLLIGSNDSQIIPVYDLDTLEEQAPIIMPGGHYPRSIAAAANAILVANRVAGPKNLIDKVDMLTRTATPLPSLGIFNNDIDVDTRLVASPNGSTILAVSADGTDYLYDANVGSFTVSRQDFTALSGAYAASNFNQYVVGAHLLNSSLVPIATLETSSGQPSGFAFMDQGALRTTTPDASSPGVIERVDAAAGTSNDATSMIEAPVLPNTTYAFTRTLAPLADQSGIISLTTSGFTVLPWDYDAAVAPPEISAVVNAADGNPDVAPGGLISIYGTQLSPVNEATTELPLPTAIAESCLTVNGMPIPMIFVSSTQINAQLPTQTTGNVTVILHTPGGVSDNYNLVIQPLAPSLFQASIPGLDGTVPAIVRNDNGLVVTPSNPIHQDDVLVMYLTGMGATTPLIDAGLPGPSSPLATTLNAPQVTLGGQAVQVLYSGLAPGEVGVYQLNVAIPKNAPTGLAVPLRIVQDGVSTTVNVRVVN